MLIYVDIDKTIADTEGEDYENAKPIKKNIVRVNKLYDEGHTIVYWTARGTMKPRPELFDMTLGQLVDWNCKFHELRLGKPAYDLLICDKTENWSVENV